jgi:AsmA protein
MKDSSPHKPKVPALTPPRATELVHTRLGPLKRGPWKLVLVIGAGVAGLLVLTLIAVNLLISADWVQARVAARVKAQTGRDLTVNGSTMLLFTPGPHVVITDAKITDPDAEAGTADLSVAKLTLDLSPSDLFSHEIDAKRVVLVRPVLTVRLGSKMPALRRSDAGGELKKIRFVKAAAAGTRKRRHDLRLNDVRIKDGTVNIVYDERDAGAERQIEHINAHMSLPTITKPLTGNGKLDWKGETVNFNFALTTPADLRAKRSARLQLAVGTPVITAQYDGSIATEPDLTGQGHLSAKAHSIPSVLAWMRATPPVSTAIGDGELGSDVSWANNEITFSNVRFTLKHASGQGRAVVALKAPRPHVRAAFALDFLDLNPFLSSHHAKAPSAGSSDHARAPSGSAAKNWFTNPAAAEVEEAVEPRPSAQAAKAAPQENAPAAPATTPMTSPASFDADVNLNVRKTSLGHLDIGPSSLGLSFRNGVMSATLGGMELYGGHARGTLVIDASQPIPAFTGNFNLEGVQAKPLLSDAAQFSMITGRTKLDLNISGAGSDADEIRSSLRGQGNVLVSDGTVEGIDITALIKSLGAGEIPNLRQGPGTKKTAFSELGGSFTISDGIAETQNLKMVSALLKVTADGTVDLTRSDLDILMHPEIVAGPEGKGGANDLAGLTVPVHIEGPLANPRINPELKALFANPESASKAVNKIGEALQKRFKGKPVGEAIGRLLGNMHIGRGVKDPAPAPKPRSDNGQPPQAEAQSGQSGQGDADEPTDPDLQQILR